MPVAAKQSQRESRVTERFFSSFTNCPTVSHTRYISPTLKFLSTGTYKQLQQETENKHASDAAPKLLGCEEIKKGVLRLELIANEDKIV